LYEYPDLRIYIYNGCDADHDDGGGDDDDDDNDDGGGDDDDDADHITLSYLKINPVITITVCISHNIY